MKIKKLEIAKEKFDNTKEELKIKTEKRLTDYSNFIYDTYDMTVEFVSSGVKKKKK